METKEHQKRDILPSPFLRHCASDSHNLRILRGHNPNLPARTAAKQASSTIPATPVAKTNHRYSITQATANQPQSPAAYGGRIEPITEKKRLKWNIINTQKRMARIKIRNTLPQGLKSTSNTKQTTQSSSGTHQTVSSNSTHLTALRRKYNSAIIIYNAPRPTE